jgi:hypothetical protein
MCQALFVCGAGDGTQGLTYIKHVLYHRAKSSALRHSYKPKTFTDLTSQLEGWGYSSVVEGLHSKARDVGFHSHQKGRKEKERKTGAGGPCL